MNSTATTSHELGELVRLRNGTRYRIRPLEAGDKPKLAEAFKRLSDESRYRRCFSVKRELNTNELTDLCHMDGHDQFALVAVSLNDGGGEGDGIGGAQFARLGKEADVAEVAFVVADDWQRRGIGRALLERLVEAARERGIRRLHCYLLSENVQARRFILGVGERSCWDVSFHNDGAIVEGDFSIERPGCGRSTSSDAEDPDVFERLRLSAYRLSVMPASVAFTMSNIWWQEVQRALARSDWAEAFA